MGTVLLGIAGMLPKGDLFLLGVFARLLPFEVVVALLPLPLLGSARVIYAIMSSLAEWDVAFDTSLPHGLYVFVLFGYAVFQEVVTFLAGYFAKDVFRRFKAARQWF